MVADAAGSRALALAGLHRPVRPRLEPPLRRPAAPLDGSGRCSRWRARGHARPWSSRPRRRADALPPRPDQADRRGAARADRLRADRGGRLPRPARLAPPDAPLVRAPRRRDLDLDLRQVPEGEEPGARPARDPADRDRGRVRRAARRADRGRGGADPRHRARSSSSPRSSPSATARGSSRSRATPRRRSRRRRRSGSRSTSTPSASPAGTTASSAGRIRPTGSALRRSVFAA